jgi:hypothetical protein
VRWYLQGTGCARLEDAGGGGSSLSATVFWFVGVAVASCALLSSVSVRYTLPQAEYLWLRDHVLADSRPLDTVFLGSSRIRTAIDPQLVCAVTPQNRPSVNLGVNWHGRNMHFVLLKDLLSSRPIRRLVLETSADMEAVGTHRVFGSLARPSDALRTPMIRVFLPGLIEEPFARNMRGLGDWIVPVLAPSLHAIRHAYDRLTRRISGPHASEIESLTALCGYLPNSGEYVEFDPPPTERVEPVRPLDSWMRSVSPDAYAFEIDRIATLCRDHNVELMFLYLPRRGYREMAPELRSVLSKHGAVICPPWDEFSDTMNWRDGNHFNLAGAKRFGVWLRSALEREPPDSDVPAGRHVSDQSARTFSVGR